VVPAAVEYRSAQDAPTHRRHGDQVIRGDAPRHAPRSEELTTMAGTGTIGKQLQDLETTAPAASSTTTKPAATAATSATATWTMPKHDNGPMLVVPAGFVGDLLGGLSGTIGEIAGGIFGDARTGKKIGDVLSDPIKQLVPFSIVPPAVAPASAGPGAAAGPSEALVVVPAGFIGGLLGGLGGSLLGSTVGGWFGDSSTGGDIGKAAGGALGAILPFSVVPPTVAPASAGPDAGTEREAMVVVPAGFFGDLVSGISHAVGDIVGGDTGNTISTVGSFGSLLPFSTVPPALAPASAGPDGIATTQELVAVPASFVGSLLTGLAGTLLNKATSDPGGLLSSAADVLSSVLPFHTLPPTLQPASASPAGMPADPRDQLMVVPAGLFGNLLSGLAGTIGGAVAGDTGKAIGEAASGLISMLPFHAVPPALVANRP
jgi:hypothetical protein